MIALREPQARIDAIRRRDPAALEDVARDNITRLVRTARASGLATEDAYDAAQETLLVFVQKADQFDGRASARTWLFGILYKKIAERRRAFAREETLDDIDAVVAARFDTTGQWLRPPQTADAAATAGEVMTRVEECLEEVPERPRSAFVLREVEQLSTDEVCKILDVSANNLGVMLYRARNRLRECLEAKGIHGSGDAAV
ncbi:MAG TPA: sigma-70 family RNA polymerase sigma factor [Gemmatimonadales bacterium]